MNARAQHGFIAPQGGRRTPRSRAAVRAAALLALLLLFGLLGAVAPAGALAAPGKPTAKVPIGTIATTTPTFTWGKAKGAAKYELRVYSGKTQLVKKTGLTKRSWKSTKAFPQNVSLSWKIRATNARGAGPWSKSLKFTVVVPSPAKAITAFSFASPAATAVINEGTHTIAVTVPFGTNVSALVPTLTITGASVSPASGVAADFTSAVTYTVTAADSSTQTYTVTVTVAPNLAAKTITAFSFASPAATGVINEDLHTIAVTVPFGTNVSALVPTLTITGASVSPASGVAVDFTSAVTYTVTAADSSTQGYAVTVTVAGAVIGQAYGGGKIAYIFQNGDPGYVVGQTHGLIAAAADQSAGIRWFNGTNLITGATGTTLGTGSANTDSIIAAQGATATSYAAGLARAYDGGGYADWYLPSQDELNKLYLNQAAIGGFSTEYYWSSTEFFSDFAYYERFSDGIQNYYDKSSVAFKVRAVRSF